MNISQYLQSSRTTQAELSRLLGVSESHISQMIKGIRHPSRRLAKKMEKMTNGKIKAVEVLGLK